MSRLTLEPPNIGRKRLQVEDDRLLQASKAIHDSLAEQSSSKIDALDARLTGLEARLKDYDARFNELQRSIKEGFQQIHKDADAKMDAEFGERLQETKDYYDAKVEELKEAYAAGQTQIATLLRDMKPPQITVMPSEVAVTNEFKPEINPTPVTVQNQVDNKIEVNPTPITNQIDVSPTPVTVNTPEVRVLNKVETPQVNVTNEVKPSDTTIQVNPTPVTVTNNVDATPPLREKVIEYDNGFPVRTVERDLPKGSKSLSIETERTET